MKTRNRRHRNREFVNKYKSRPCMDCGIQHPLPAMSFDHVRGKKIFNLGGGLGNRTMKQIVDEIKKCDVVCLNCHAIREEKRRS